MIKKGFVYSMYNNSYELKTRQITQLKNGQKWKTEETQIVHKYMKRYLTSFNQGNPQWGNTESLWGGQKLKSLIITGVEMMWGMESLMQYWWE